MKCRICRILICIFFSFFALNVSASDKKCDEKYINWMSRIIEEKKAVVGGISPMIPTSLPLAQSILETGYGKSYSAKKRHNYFGLSFKNKLMVFDMPSTSVHKYFKTLNYHGSYDKFRAVLGAGIYKPKVLVKSLAPVYAEDKAYAKKISQIIEKCNLEKYDSKIVMKPTYDVIILSKLYN